MVVEEHTVHSRMCKEAKKSAGTLPGAHGSSLISVSSLRFATPYSVTWYKSTPGPSLQPFEASLAAHAYANKESSTHLLESCTWTKQFVIAFFSLQLELPC